MSKRLILILAIYSVAGLLALDLHAATPAAAPMDDDAIAPPTAEEQAPAPAPAQPPAQKPAPRPASKTQQKPSAPPQADVDAQDCDQCQQPEAGEENRPVPPTRRQGRFEVRELECGAGHLTIGDNNGNLSICHDVVTDEKYTISIDSVGLEIGGGYFRLKVRSVPGSDIHGRYFGDGLSGGFCVGASGGKFYMRNRSGARGVNSLELIGGGGGFGLSKINSIRIRPN